MPFISNITSHDKLRLLISGLSNTGKTTSLLTFIYGYSDYTDIEQRLDAIAYADEQSKHMVMISCPGETGHRSLITNTAHVTSYYDEREQGERETSAHLSAHIMEEFKELFIATVKNKPDILALDGIPGLWKHWMNCASDGDYFAGLDLSKSGDGGKYRAAALHSRTHNVFDYFIDQLYKCPIPLVICTTREEWEGGQRESDRAGGLEATRYLWPNIPGSMAREVVGKFDARISARLESRCLHSGCEDSRMAIDHYIWQFHPRGDVQGVGIKGLKLNKRMRDVPYIHQYAPDLMDLITQFSQRG